VAKDFKGKRTGKHLAQRTGWEPAPPKMTGIRSRLCGTG